MDDLMLLVLMISLRKSDHTSSHKGGLLFPPHPHSINPTPTAQSRKLDPRAGESRQVQPGCGTPREPSSPSAPAERVSAWRADQEHLSW